MSSENSNNNNGNMNSALVNDSYVINILNENENENKIDVSDDNVSDISDEDNTNLKTILNSDLNLPKKDLKKIQKFYKKPEENNRINNNEEKIVKMFIIILFIIIGAPIVICDLYYGYTDNSCINDYPNGLNINMKIYLLVNGYYGLTIISLISLFIACISTKNIEDNISLIVISKITPTIFLLFITVWNIIGSVIFWGKLYKEGNCDKNISTYLFVTLIIKLLGNTCTINNMINKQ
jgi:hypothetical protein